MTNIPDNKTTLVPTSNDMPQIVRQPYSNDPEYNLNPDDPGAVELGYEGIKDPVVRLSQNMKLRMRHVGFKSNDVAVNDEWTWDGKQAVPPEGRSCDDPYATTSTKLLSEYGTFETTMVSVYESDPAGEVRENVRFIPAESESTEDSDGTEDSESSGLIEAVDALAADQEFHRVNNLMAGRRGEDPFDPITQENYLTRPGMEVETSKTYLSLIEDEESGSESDEDESGEESTNDPSTSESESESESESGEESTNDTPVTPPAEETPTYTIVDKSEVTEPQSGVQYYTLNEGTYVEWSGTTWPDEDVYISSSPKKVAVAKSTRRGRRAATTVA